MIYSDYVLHDCSVQTMKFMQFGADTSSQVPRDSVPRLILGNGLMQYFRGSISGSHHLARLYHAFEL